MEQAHFFLLGWNGTESTITEATTGLFYQPRMIMMMRVEKSVECLTRKPVVLRETCHSAILSTTNPTWPDPRPNPRYSGGTTATNCLNYGTALNRLKSQGRVKILIRHIFLATWRHSSYTDDHRSLYIWYSPSWCVAGEVDSRLKLCIKMNSALRIE
jgi:hypothetical protein